MLTKPAHAFSALQAVLMAASAGSFTHLTDEDFILDRRVVGGMQQVSLLIAQELGDDVVLNSPVRTINWEPDADGGHRVTVESEQARVNARFVIMAVPPNLYSRVSFNPPLPRRQHQMHQHQSLGLVIKVHAVYTAVLAEFRPVRHVLRRGIPGPGGLRQHQLRRHQGHAGGIHLG
jgi:putrescine oxidase